MISTLATLGLQTEDWNSRICSKQKKNIKNPMLAISVGRKGLLASHRIVR